MEPPFAPFGASIRSVWSLHSTRLELPVITIHIHIYTLLFKEIFPAYMYARRYAGRFFQKTSVSSVSVLRSPSVPGRASAAIKCRIDRISSAERFSRSDSPPLEVAGRPSAGTGSFFAFVFRIILTFLVTQYIQGRSCGDKGKHFFRNGRHR